MFINCGMVENDIFEYIGGYGIKIQKINIDSAWNLFNNYNKERKS